MKKRFFINAMACSVLVVCVLFCSCGSNEDFYVGNGKDKDSVRDEIFGENSTEDDSFDESSNVGTALPDDAPDKVYFTESGTVWHTKRDCSHIRNSASVIEGTLSEALDKGKGKQCSSCAEADAKDGPEEPGESDDELTDEPSDDTDGTLKVFWLRSGSVWHKSEECSYISGSTDLQSGSLNDAYGAGIDKPCSRCAKDSK